MKQRDSGDMLNYLRQLLGSGQFRRLIGDRFFQGTITSVKASGNAFLCQIRRTGDTSSDGNTYLCATPGYTPVSGDVVECVWRDLTVGYVLWPIAGVAVNESSGYGLISRTVIQQGTTTYTVPTGTRAILVQAIGAGGGGGGCTTVAASAAVGGGGGGGGYSEVFLTAPKLTAFTVAVGLGGLAGTNAGGNGGLGGDTTFDSPSTCTAKGGQGGTGEVAGTALAFVGGGAGGASGSGVGTTLLSGNGGGFGERASGLLGASGWGGAGAGALGGGGGLALVAGAVGNVGGNYGGGGSGGLVLNNSAAVAGGAGANGLLVISEFA